MPKIDTFTKVTAWTTRNGTLLASGVVVLLVAVLGIGFEVRPYTYAAAGRDCGDEVNGVHNSIANNPNSGGGCGALTPAEHITDLTTGSPDDQAAVAAHFGLPASEYDNFKNHAVMGTAKQNGEVVDNEGRVVMNNAWSIGRVQFSYGSPYTPLSGVGSFFKSMHTDVLQQDLPVMLMFDEEGSVQTAILTSCGNPSNGEKVKSGAKCKDLIMTPVEGKKNTYSFTTDATKFGHAQFVKFEYFADEGNGEKLLGTGDSPTDAVEATFTKDATVKVKITVSVPGNKQRVIVSDHCVKEVKVHKDVVFHVCKALVATAVDSTNRKFRFTVHTDQSATVKVVSANFILDGSATVKDVTDKDEAGHIFKEYSFTDSKEHTVSAVVNFEVDGKSVQSKETCEAKVTPEKKPVPIKVLSVKTTTPQPLPETGPAGMIGLFAGVSAAGAAGHHLFRNYRSGKSRQ